MRTVLNKVDNRSPYFEGWYLKQQNGEDTLALIPSVHRDADGGCCASLQVITREKAYRLQFPQDRFFADPRRSYIRIENNIFSPRGCRLDLNRDGLALKGTLRYGLFTRPKYDMMGPFCAVPLLQCRHSVFSYHHRVDGRIDLNGKNYCFRDGTGYAEGDRGISFPTQYLWTQCSWDKNCIMLSIAEIPIGSFRFNGCIGGISLGGREYRFATYLGLKILEVRSDFAAVRQGEITLTIKLLKGNPQPLSAPVGGRMARTIHESADCTVRYRIYRKGRLIFELTNDSASFESDWPAAKKKDALDAGIRSMVKWSRIL